ncbi:MAG: DUF4190 domain-containing protein [Actinobacteria bacterium]|nr:DUF4190 domain-containing protein [Actinomycetota bacterium]
MPPQAVPPRPAAPQPTAYPGAATQPPSPYGQPPVSVPPSYAPPAAVAPQPAYGQPQPPLAPGYPGAAPTQPGYAAPAYAPPYGQPYAAPLRSNGLAIAALICGIVGLVVVPFLPSIAAVITGHMGLSQTKHDPALGGRGFAITGLVLGYIGVGFWLLIGGLMLLGFLAAASSSYSGY